MNRNAVPASSPTLPPRLRWVRNERTSYQPQSGRVSPNVSLIPFDAMPPQQNAQFVLKTNLSVMLFLACYNRLTCSRFDSLTEKSA